LIETHHLNNGISFLFQDKNKSWKQDGAILFKTLFIMRKSFGRFE